MKFDELKKAAAELVAEGIWNVTGNVEVMDEAGAQVRKIYSLSFSYPRVVTDIAPQVDADVDTGEDAFEDATSEGEELCTPDEMVAYLKRAMARFGGPGPDGADIKVKTAPNGDTIVTCRKIEISGDDEEGEEGPKKPHKCCCGNKGCCNKQKESDMIKAMVEAMVGPLNPTDREKREAWKAMREIFG